MRPAGGYAACPDHAEKATLFRLCGATKNADIQLTEGFSMYPVAAVSGWYFSHPDSQKPVVGKLTKDQVESYAKRKGFLRAFFSGVAESDWFRGPPAASFCNRPSVRRLLMQRRLHNSKNRMVPDD